MQRMFDASLFDGFVVWARELAANARSERASVEVEICPPSSNQAVNLHLECDDLMARITFWADGTYHVEALDVATGTTVLSRHGCILAISGIDEEFEDILQKTRLCAHRR